MAFVRFLMINLLCRTLADQSGAGQNGSTSDDQLGANDSVGSICPDEAQQASGFLPAGQGNEYFYWLASSRSDAPSKDPLILWMTGGPGCSSTLAAIAENGPCKVTNRTAFGGFRMEKRRWSWTEAANVVWIDQPAGVGFSSRSNASGLAHNESQVAADMLVFLQNFFAKYTDLAKVPFYIFGESYAGHYVPAVAAKVLEATGREINVSLAGIGIGNGLVSPLAQFVSKPDMAWGGGKGGSLQKRTVSLGDHMMMERMLPLCLDKITKCQATSESDHRACMDAYFVCLMAQYSPIMKSGLNPYDLRKKCAVPGSGLCYNESNEIAFMNDPAVQKMFGVRQPEQWIACNMTVSMEFVKSGDWFKDMQPQVRELLASGVAVLVYSGDDDYMVDWLGTKEWMYNFEWNHSQAWVDAPNKGLYVDGTKRGMVKTAFGLTFVQVYQSGHLVPMDEPEVSVAMIKEFMSTGSFWRQSGYVSNFTNATSNAQEAALAVRPFLQDDSFVYCINIASIIGLCAGLSLFVVQIGRVHQQREDRAYYLMA